MEDLVEVEADEIPADIVDVRVVLDPIDALPETVEDLTDVEERLVLATIDVLRVADEDPTTGALALE